MCESENTSDFTAPRVLFRGANMLARLQRSRGSVYAHTSKRIMQKHSQHLTTMPQLHRHRPVRPGQPPGRLVAHAWHSVEGQL